jgi:hypothetical protein
MWPEIFGCRVATELPKNLNFSFGSCSPWNQSSGMHDHHFLETTVTIALKRHRRA